MTLQVHLEGRLAALLLYRILRKKCHGFVGRGAVLSRAAAALCPPRLACPRIDQPRGPLRRVSRLREWKGAKGDCDGTRGETEVETDLGGRGRSLGPIHVGAHMLIFPCFMCKLKLVVGSP